MISTESVLSGPNLTLELSTIGLLKKEVFFSRRPSASSKKKLVFFSSTFGESSKIRLDPERTDSILLKVGFREIYCLLLPKRKQAQALKKLNFKVKS